METTKKEELENKQMTQKMKWNKPIISILFISKTQLDDAFEGNDAFDGAS